MNNPNDFYRFRAEAGDEPTTAELMIFSQIGDWEDMGDVSARAFAKDLAALPSSVKRLDIHINSPGGSVFEAQGIYSRLADHRSTKHVYVDGLAASAASIVAMVGHKIYIRANANMMIHLPSGLVMGNAEDMRHMVAALDSITESMVNVYAKRTGLDREEVHELLAAETWFSPQAAVDKGFADEIRGVVKAAAIVGEKRVIINGVEHDLSRFHNVPAFSASTTTKGNTMPTKPKVKPTANAEEEETETPTPTPPPNPPTPPETPPAPPVTEPKKPGTPAPTGPPGQVPDPATPATHSEYDRGITAERERVTALQALDRPATHAIVTAAIKDGKQPADIVAACMEAMDKAGNRSARFQDASQLNGIPPSDGADDTNAFAESLKKKVKARAKGVRPSHSRN